MLYVELVSFLLLVSSHSGFMTRRGEGQQLAWRPLSRTGGCSHVHCQAGSHAAAQAKDGNEPNVHPGAVHSAVTSHLMGDQRHMPATGTQAGGI